MARGHAVTIFCRKREGDFPDLTIVELPNIALTNHGRNLRFARHLSAAVKDRFDVVAGFNKMPSIDILYCADPPAKQPRNLFDRINPRVRGMHRLEASCFGPQSGTQLLLLAEPQRDDYQRIWAMKDARVAVMPPTIERNRAQPGLRGSESRAEMRDKLGLASSTLAWLFVAGFPETKGFDRIISALPAFPHVKVLCAGFDLADPKLSRLAKQAAHLDVAHQIVSLGRREDIPALMAAGDLLVHPSRLDITGTVILEAMVNGLPVVTTALCGYAPHVAAADAGVVIREPFAQRAFVSALEQANDPARRARWSANAAAYGAANDLYSGLDRAADAIERAARTSR
jgi:UDP-glucose:(heptosyl)LPS alpha-1,3-glucosyltransferase